MREARLKLKNTTFLVWTYFSENQDGYEFALSREDVLKSCGISKATYDRAIKELQETGYLIPYTFNNGIQGYQFVQDGCVSSKLSHENDVQSNLSHNVQSILSHDVVSNLTDVSSNLSHTRDNSDERNITNNTLNNTKMIQDSTVLSSIEDIPFDIQSYIKELSSERQVECVAKVAALHRDKGYSYELLLAALNMKDISNWEQYGFGLLYKSDFIKQAELFVEVQKNIATQYQDSSNAAASKLAREAELLSEEMGISIKEAYTQLQLE